MKKFSILLLCAAICLSLCSCGGIKTELTQQSWKNVNDGDTYTFTSDGKGSHDGKEFTYTVEDNAVYISEGASAAAPRKFTYFGENEPKKLMPENEKSYYVTESDYPTVSKNVLSENIQALGAYDGVTWKSTTNNAYTTFIPKDLNYGVGVLSLPGQMIDITYEMLDNNTLKTEFLNNGVTMTSTLDIVNNDGVWQLVDNQKGNVLWIRMQVNL